MTTSPAARELQIVRAATRLLRKALNATQPERTRLLRETADLLIDLRALHTDAEGNPDWRGKSFAYRDAVRDIYAGAGLPKDGSDSTKTALRYHIGNALRDRLTEDELRDAGLSTLDPRERQAHRRSELDESVPQTVDSLISSLTLASRRLEERRGNKVSKHDIARVQEAQRRLEEWLTAHRAK